VDCIRRYIGACFEESRRALFHKSVESSIDTVHAICSSKVYQNEYLAKASCFKQVSVEHCGRRYRELIDTVSNSAATDDHICCHYAHFKECVNRPLLEECGRKARNLMDHSMSFLISRCQYYQYETRECSKPPEANVLERADEEEGPSVLVGEGAETTSTDASNNRIEAANQRLREDVDPLAGSSRFDDTSAEQVGSSTTMASTSTVAEEKANQNAIDSIETSESRDGKQAELLIVYTMKPESQIALGALGYDGSSAKTQELGVSLLSLIISLGLVQWFQLA